MSEIIHIQSLFAESGCLTLHGMRAHLDARLSETEDDQVIGHLLECELCSEALGGIEMVPQNVAIVAAVADVNDRVKAKIEASAQPKVNYPWAPAVAAAAAVLLLFSLLLWQMIEDPAQNDSFAEVHEIEKPIDQPKKELEKDLKSDLEILEDNEPLFKKEAATKSKVEIAIPLEEPVAENSIGLEDIEIEEEDEMSSGYVFVEADGIAMVEEAPEPMVEEILFDRVDDFDDDLVMEKEEEESKNMEGLNRELMNTRSVSETQISVPKNDKYLAESNSGYNVQYTQKKIADSRKEAKKKGKASKERAETVATTDLDELDMASDTTTFDLMGDDIAMEEVSVNEVTSTPSMNKDVEQPMNFRTEDQKSSGQKDKGNANELLAAKNKRFKEEKERAVNNSDDLVSQSTGMTASNHASSGMVYFQAGNYRSAHDSFEAALDLNPNAHETRLFYARCLLELNAPEKALPELEALLEVPGLAIYEEVEWYHIQALIAMEKPEEAKENLKSIVRKNGAYRSRAQKKLSTF